MRKTILHIGYPKTATTWFQENFYPNILNYTYFNRKEFNEKFTSPSDFFLDYVLNFSNYNYIICEETILGHGGRKEQALKIEKLYKAFPCADVVVFIRNQFSIIESNYSLYIMLGGTMTLKELILSFFLNEKINKWRYYDYLTPYIQCFGKERVHIFLYEDFKTNFEYFIQNYITKFNFDIFGKILTKKVNKSYPAYILKLARFTNQFSKHGIINSNKIAYMHVPYCYQMTHKFYRQVHIGPSLKLEKKLNKILYQRLYDYFVEDNQKLIKEFNLDLKKYNYPL